MLMPRLVLEVVMTLDRGQPVWRALAVVAVVASSLRLLAAIVSGVLAAVPSQQAPTDQVRAGQIFSGFGAAGDTVGAALAVVTLALAVLAAHRGRALVVAAEVVVGLTAASIVAVAVGAVLVATGFPGNSAGPVIARAVGFAVADLLLCVGGGLVVARLLQPTNDDAATGIEPVIFAVDRADGEVFAFFSRQEAARTLNVYSIEDDEFLFYGDDGAVIIAQAVGSRIEFTVTDERDPAALLAHLQQFAVRAGLTVDPDVFNEPWAYAHPISEWQWLQLWPGWMRPLGRLVRAIAPPR
jgi:hypothetical protein